MSESAERATAPARVVVEGTAARAIGVDVDVGS